MGGKKFSLWLFLFSLALFVWLFSLFLKPFIVATLLVLATLEFSKKCDIFFENSKYEVIKAQTKLLSASVLTPFFGVIIFLPTAYFILYIINDTMHFDLSHISKLRQELEAFVSNTEFLNGYAKEKFMGWIGELFSEQFWSMEAKYIFSAVSNFATQIATSLAELVMIVIFFFLLHLFKTDIVAFLKPLVPLEEHKKEILTKETISAISVVFIMLLGIMLAQGIAFFALMLFFDYDALVLGFFSALSSIVPIFGTALVWVPIAISEAMKGNIVGALVIAAYSWFVMAFVIDNFVRLYLLNKATKMLKTEYKINEFLLFFSIAAGIASFGFWGVIIGPSVTALFISSAKLYKNDVL